MLTSYPVWDVSWLVAYIFTWGSAIWVLNGLFVFLPFLHPSWTFHNEVLVGGGITAFVGTCVFEIGSVLLFLEATNANQETCFGWAIERVFQDHHVSWTLVTGACTHHHRNRKSLFETSHRATTILSRPKDTGMSGRISARSWSWYPSWYEVKTHYSRNVGFIACVSQLIGSTIFWIGGFASLPGIINHLTIPEIDGVVQFPFLFGAVFFVLSGFLFTVETQKDWWRPAPRVLGWHIGVWNFIGGIGFLLSPAFGFNQAHWSQYQAACITLWSSCAFLIASLMQLFESLQKSPVMGAGAAS